MSIPSEDRKAIWCSRERGTLNLLGTGATFGSAECGGCKWEVSPRYGTSARVVVP